MVLYALAFLIGMVSGLRTFTGLAAISWAAHFRWLHLEDTGLAFLGHAATPYIVSALAIGELVGDKLPTTPSRKQPVGFAARLIAGSLCGAALGLTGGAIAGGIVAGLLGAVVGTLGGASCRALVAKAFGKDLPAALLEDAVAIGVAFFVVTR